MTVVNPLFSDQEVVGSDQDGNGTGVVQVARVTSSTTSFTLLSRKVVIMKACSYKRGKSRVRTIIIVVIIIIIIIIISIIYKITGKKKIWMNGGDTAVITVIATC